MKKLKFLSFIIILLLFCPFIKQCDGLTKRNEEIPHTDSTSVQITTNKINNETIEFSDENTVQPKESFSSEIKTYFIEDSENVFEIAYEHGKSIFDVLITEKKSIINDKGFITVFSFFLFAVLLIISSLSTLVFTFLEKFRKIKLLTILNIVFIISIVITFLLSGLFERIGQIKIGFYLLLFSNLYMLYLLKQKKEQIQH